MKSDYDPLAVEREFFTALIEANIEKLGEVLADDFVLIDVMRGDEVSKSSLLDVLGSRQLKFASIEPADSHVRVYDQTAIITGRTRITGHFGEIAFSVKSRYTHVFIEQETRWRMVSAQGTQIVEG